MIGLPILGPTNLAFGIIDPRSLINLQHSICFHSQCGVDDGVFQYAFLTGFPLFRGLRNGSEAPLKLLVTDDCLVHPTEFDKDLALVEKSFCHQLAQG